MLLERVSLLCYLRNVSVEPVGLHDAGNAVMLFRTRDKYDMTDSYNCVIKIPRT